MSVGTFTRAKRCSIVSGLRTNTPKLIAKFDTYGNGCAGSTASGVNTGKSWRSKYVVASRFSAEVRSSQRTISTS